MGLRIGPIIVLPADDHDDEVSLQLVDCDRCDFQAVAVYRENHWGAEEAWHFEGYVVPVELRAALESAISSCPEPQNRRCPCAGHRKAVGISKDIYDKNYPQFKMDPD